MNDARCPECDRMIRVNMARHLRLVHSEYVCFWRCPVPSCSLWFTSELNAKDHIENIHRSTNVSGYMAWSGSAARASSMAGDRRTSRSGWIWRSHVVPARSSGTTISSLRVRNSLHCADSSTTPSISSRSSIIPC